MMSEDLNGVFDPDALLDDAFPVIEFMGQKLKFRFMSIARKGDEMRYYLELVGDFDLSDLQGRDYTDIKIKSETIEKGNIIGLKISPKALKLRFRRHTYEQG